MPLKCPAPRVPPTPVEEYYRNVMMPGNVAVSAMRRAGIPINVERIQQQRAEWVQRLADYEAYLSNDAKRSGIELVFSEKHVPGRAALTEYIYGRGKGYPVEFTTPTGLPSTDDEALLRYASISNPWPDDDQDLTMLLKIRSLSKGINTFLDSFEGE